MNPQQTQQPAMPDMEGKMAKSELYRAAKMSMKLFQMIQDGQQLEGWVQAKITKSADYLDSIYHYMEYQMKFGSGATVTSVDDITGDLEPAAVEEPEEDEATESVKESMTYEQRLQALLEAKVKGKKPDFLDMDKDGDKKEPMKQAVADKKKNPFAKKTDEGFDSDAKVGDTFKTSKGTATKTKTGVVHTRDKYDYDPGSDDKDDKKAKRVAKKVKEAAPSAGMTKGEKSAVVKKAKAGGDIGKPGKGFAKVASKAANKYGSKEKGQAVAAAAMWKNAAK